MIYDAVQPDHPVRQGDIFRNIPRVEFSLASLAVIQKDGGPLEATWEDMLSDETTASGIVAAVAMKPVHAIVITQDCDAARAEYLSLVEVIPYSAAIGADSLPKDARAWQSKITKHSRDNLRYFYLPADPGRGIGERMAADFRMVLRVRRDDLDSLRSERLGHLNREAYEHFRESLAQFLRRYPYDEWYPLTKDEFSEYAAKQREPIKPRPWQM